MKLLRHKPKESNQNANSCRICRENFEDKYAKDKKYCKVRDHCHYTSKDSGAAHSTCNLKYVIPKKIAIIIHNGSNYRYHFIINELAEEFEGQFTCLGGNTVKCKACLVLIEK